MTDPSPSPAASDRPSSSPAAPIRVVVAEDHPAVRSGLVALLGSAPDITVVAEAGDGVLHITARAASCDGEPGGEIPDHAACHLYQQDWGIPVTVHTPDRAPEGAETRLDLDLRGIH